MITYLTNESAQFKELLPNIIQGFGVEVRVRHSLSNLHFGSDDFLITDRFSQMVPAEYCSLLVGRCFNLHASLLPLNRGSYPLLNALARHEPIGYTIHELASRVDSGRILWQEQVAPDWSLDTLYTLWLRVQLAMIAKAALICNQIFEGSSVALNSVDTSRHSSSFAYRECIDKYKSHMPNGWNTKISVFVDSLEIK